MIQSSQRDVTIYSAFYELIHPNLKIDINTDSSRWPMDLYWGLYSLSDKTSYCQILEMVKPEYIGTELSDSS